MEQKAPNFKQTKNIIEGIERMSWDTTACLCYAGSVAVAIRYLGEEVTDDYVMGVSGGAFSMIWGMPWSAANCDLLVIGEDPLRYAFNALGYEYTAIYRDPNDPMYTKEFFRQMIVDNIDQKCPVIATGVLGPECCVISGYDMGGDVLYGWSYYQIVAEYYQGDAKSYFKKDDWYRDFYELVIIGNKKPQPSRYQIFKNTLAWAIRLTRVPEHLLFIDGQAERFMSGLAAYDAMIDALLRDKDFPAGNLDVLTFRCVPISNDGIPLLCEKRKSAIRFLNSLVAEGYPCADELQKATESYSQETQLLDRAAAIVPFTYAPEEDRLRMADPLLRKEVARLVSEAKEYEKQAVEHLEKALKELVTVRR